MRVYPIDYHIVTDQRYSTICMICYNWERERVAVLIRYPLTFYVSGISHYMIRSSLTSVAGVSVCETPERRKSTRDALTMLDAYRIECDNTFVRGKAISILENVVGACIHETNHILTSLLKMIDETNISYYTWIDIEVEEINPTFTTMKREFRGDYRTIKKLEELPPTLSILSFDLECNSVDPNVMCNATRDMGNDIKICGITYVDDSRYVQYAIVNGPDIKEIWGRYGVEKAHIISVSSELRLLEYFFAIIQKLDPDVIMGHNIAGFDIPYIISRWGILRMLDGQRASIPNISRYKDFDVTPVNVDWNNSQVAMSGKLLRVPGRIWIDTLILAARSYLGKMENNKLDTLAKVHLGMSKNDVSHKDMFSWFSLWPTCKEEDVRREYERGMKKYNKVVPPVPKDITLSHLNDLIVMINVMNQSGDRKKLYSTRDVVNKTIDLVEEYHKERKVVEEMVEKWNIPYVDNVEDMMKTLWWIVVRYCIHDTRIPYRIVHLNKIVTVLTEQSNIFCVSINDVLCRGQIHAVTSSQYRYARSIEYLVDIERVGDPSNVEKVGGGFVAHNKPGLKIPDDDSVIIVFDFSSLYPTIAIANNICYTTWVPYEKRGTTIPREMCRVFNINDRVDSKTGEKLPDLEHWFLKEEYARGVVPSMLWTQYGDRKMMKKKARDTEGTPMYWIYNAQQLATKVGMNSAYGAFGTKHSPICNKAAGDTITGVGRQSIKKTNELLAAEGLEVVYNDTDSAMVLIRGIKERFNDSIPALKAYASDLCKRLSSHFPRPMELEAENYFVSFFLRSPKMYTAIKIDDISLHLSDYGMKYIETNDLLYVKGLASVRRDKYYLYKVIFNKILEMILTKKSPEYVTERLEYYIDYIWKMRNSKEYDRVERLFHYNCGVTATSLTSTEGFMGKWILRYEQYAKRKPLRGERFQLIVCDDGSGTYTKSAPKLHTKDWMMREGKILDMRHYLSCFDSDGGIVHLLNIAYGPEYFPRGCVTDYYLIRLLNGDDIRT